MSHSLNLVLKHLMIWLKENDLEIAPEIVEVEYFLSSITSMFHYSFQKEAEYKQFREEFLKTKKNE